MQTMIRLNYSTVCLMIIVMLLSSLQCNTLQLHRLCNNNFHKHLQIHLKSRVKNRLHSTNSDNDDSNDRVVSPFNPDFKPFHHHFPSITANQWQLLNELSIHLYDWNSKVNLISRKDIDLLIPNHIIPSLSISLVHHFENKQTVIDVGTGGGLPGLPLACICPNAHFTLIDSNGKKMAIVEDIATKLRLTNLRVVRSRAEDFQSEKFDFMLGRAVSALPNFLSFSSHFMKSSSSSTSSSSSSGSSSSIPTTGLLYLKGGDFTQELTDAGISQHKLFPVKELVSTISNSDKNVLYLPASEITSFHQRLLVERENAAIIAKNNKKKKQ